LLHILKILLTFLYPPSERSETGGHTVFTFVSVYVCVYAHPVQSSSLPQRTSHLPHATHLPLPTHLHSQTHLAGHMPSLSAFLFKFFLQRFYARQRSYSVYMLWQFRLSVCPSVCPSVTRVDQPKTVEARITQFSPYSSPIPLVFRG